jgi:dihydrofolate reductase
MIISIIAAMAENRVIGRGNEMPWEIPSELKRFKETTMGHPVIMGRKTFESIGQPLPGRKNIVITGRQDYSAEGSIIVPDLQAALAASAGADEVFVCGGDTVYREAMPLADRIYLTIIDEEFDGDSFFPEIPDDFVEVQRTRVDEDVLPYDMVLYERTKKQAGDERR